MKNPTILVSAKDQGLREDLRGRLLAQGFNVIQAPGRARAKNSNKKPDLVVIGSSRESRENGLKIRDRIHLKDGDAPVIFITRHSTDDGIIDAFRAGANDYLKAPFSNSDLAACIRRNLPGRFDSARGSMARVPGSNAHPPMVGESAPMREINESLIKIAGRDSTVLITGETGTGKELAAGLIHERSSRRKKPFICINCAALPDNLVESELFGYKPGAFTGATTVKKGKFDLARGGVIFLDEIGDMDLKAQAKILRTIERKESYPLGASVCKSSDFRIIAATNKDPERITAEGRFRKDLYFRLNVARIHLPPLRERMEDVPRLLDYYIEEFNGRFGLAVEEFTKEALDFLLHYDWPGNIRELKNLVEASFVNLPPGRVQYADLPPQFQKQLKRNPPLPVNERDRILGALMETSWNKSAAARRLKWCRMTLYRKIKKYNIVEKKIRSAP
ncbi:MAG: sigma-54-dependent Fis family transcriptional regulator [Desulfobacterales bacterium]|nr:sigma-54-dependent Fis family transcriptional regulator [Desulfobacterales bacterium]